MIDVVLDPGHGGACRRGYSTPTGVVGQGGAREKDLTLLLAGEMAERLRGRSLEVRLTRERDVNPSLRQRAQLARSAAARIFVSLHLNSDSDASVDGCQTFQHRRSDRALADTLHAALLGAGLADRGCFAADLAVLDPSAHAPATAACLVELAYLSCPERERSLRDPNGRAPLVAALSDGIADFLAGIRRRASARARFDVWHEVPLVPQLSGMSCWAAAAAMLIGWRECIAVDSEEIARGTGRWEDYRDGLCAEDVETLAAACGFLAEPVERLTLARLRALLEEFGPLWMGEASSGLHVLVVAGAWGDGTPDSTFVRVADPWPPGRGERYTLSFRQLVASLAAAAELSGVETRILHNPPGRGARSLSYQMRLDRSAISG